MGMKHVVYWISDVKSETALCTSTASGSLSKVCTTYIIRNMLSTGLLLDVHVDVDNIHPEG